MTQQTQQTNQAETLKLLNDTINKSANVFAACRALGRKSWDFYNGYQWEDKDLLDIQKRGQQPIVHNCFMQFGNNLLGHLQTQSNSIVVKPQQVNDAVKAKLLTEVINNIFRNNDMSTELNKIRLDGINTGLLVAYIQPEDTGKKDRFNRPIYSIKVDYVPSDEVYLDPTSQQSDYSDARYIHRTQMLSKENIASMLDMDEDDEKLKQLNNTWRIVSNFAYQKSEYGGHGQGYYRTDDISRGSIDDYQIVHSIYMKNKKKYSVYWHNNIILHEMEITYSKVKFPYRVFKFNYTNSHEYFGLFATLFSTQKWINDALTRRQFDSVSHRYFVQLGGSSNDAIENKEKFDSAVESGETSVAVQNINGVKEMVNQRDIDNAIREYLDGVERFRQQTGITNAFLGEANASDSGYKTQIQKQFGTVQLRKHVDSFNEFLRLLSKDALNYVQDYFYAEQSLALVEEEIGRQFIELNTPALIPSGKVDNNGQPIMDMVFRMALNPANNKPLTDEDNNVIMEPIPTLDSEIAYMDSDIVIDTVFNDEEHQMYQAQEFIQWLNTPIGQLLLQTDPEKYYRLQTIALKMMPANEYTPEAISIIREAGMKYKELQQQPNNTQQETQ